MVVVALLGTLLSMAGGLAPAGATATGCGSLSSSTDVSLGRPGSCSVPPSSPPYTSFRDGQKIDIAMGPNSLFSPKDSLGGDIEAIECEYRTSTGAPGDPSSAEYCDAQTAAGDFPYPVAKDGSFDYAADNSGNLMTVFGLPGKQLTTATITCDAKHACVWYVGENYNDFTAPHVFSAPFLVDAAPSSGGSFPTTLVVVLVVLAVLVLALGTARLRRVRAQR